MNLVPYRPLSGTVIDLTLKLVLETSVTIETVVVIGGFTHKPATILLPSLYRSGLYISAEWGSQKRWNP